MILLKPLNRLETNIFTKSPNGNCNKHFLAVYWTGHTRFILLLFQAVSCLKKLLVFFVFLLSGGGGGHLRPRLIMLEGNCSHQSSDPSGPAGDIQNQSFFRIPSEVIRQTADGQIWCSVAHQGVILSNISKTKHPVSGVQHRHTKTRQCNRLFEWSVLKGPQTTQLMQIKSWHWASLAWSPAAGSKEFPTKY